jgi:NAD+ synthase (glutamine-hydrolysing)
LEGNAQLLRGALDAARDVGATLVVFPELALTGYPPEDLLLTSHFIQASRRCLDSLVPYTRGLTAIVGTIWHDADLYNSAVVLHDGTLVGRYDKQLLPTYGVFDEHRYFRRGRNSGVFQLGELRFGVSICEDMWVPDGPFLHQAVAGRARLLLNLSASPFAAGKGEVRARMLATRAADTLSHVAYCNLVGGQDELVFDGESLVFGPDGILVARGPQFDTGLVVCDIIPEMVARKRLLDPRGRHGGVAPEVAEVTVLEPTVAAEASVRREGTSVVSPKLDEMEEIYRALVLGTRDYVRKSGFREVLLGLSGGIDSALTAAIAVDAVGPEHVLGISMPTRYSSAGSVGDSRVLAERLGIGFEVVAIESIFEQFLNALGPFFGEGPAGLAEENLQPRIRGTLLMAVSNKRGALVLTTGNKSEVGVGYSTLYGDTAGGFAVLKDVPKTLVYKLALWINARAGRYLIPREIIDKAPSAELRPDQKDADSLPPYEVLDPILLAYVEQNESAADIVAKGYDASVVDRVVKLVDRSEYKRRQSPPGVKITARAFGRDWRLPIARRYGS